jgi:hypothetical protein
MIGFESFCNRVQNKGNAGRVGQQFSQLRAEKYRKTSRDLCSRTLGRAAGCKGLSKLLLQALVLHAERVSGRHLVWWQTGLLTGTCTAWQALTLQADRVTGRHTHFMQTRLQAGI